jgi:hypothetical protein
MTVNYASETIVKAVREAFKAAKSLDYTPEQALEEAIGHFETVADREWAKATFNLLVMRAQELDQEEHEDDSIFYDGVAALLSVAMELDAMIPMDDRA